MDATPPISNETAADRSAKESSPTSIANFVPYRNPFVNSSALIVPKHDPGDLKPIKKRRVSWSYSDNAKTQKSGPDGVNSTESVARTRLRLKRMASETDSIKTDPAASGCNVESKKSEEGSTVSEENDSLTEEDSAISENDTESENSKNESHLKNQNHHDKMWMDMFQRLVAYKEKHNTTKVPYNYEEDVQLKNWVHCQRHYCKREDRRAKLDSIGFEWQATKYRNWDEMFQRLLEFKEDHGHTRVPLKYKVDPLLGSWVKRQRVRCHRPDRIIKLNAIDFQWRVMKRYNWDEMFLRLLDYKAKHNSAKVPRNYPEDPDLATWVRIQRFDCRELRKRELLDKIGFKWAVRKEEEWDVMYNRLVEYTKKYNTTCVPNFHEDAQLEKWVRTQRYHCKREDRMKRLNDIGFIWKCEKKTVSK